eukprot:829013-Pyramimonas_sp.AAC.1
MRSSQAAPGVSPGAPKMPPLPPSSHPPPPSHAPPPPPLLIFPAILHHVFPEGFPQRLGEHIVR